MLAERHALDRDLDSAAAQEGASLPRKPSVRAAIEGARGRFIDRRSIWHGGCSHAYSPGKGPGKGSDDR